MIFATYNVSHAHIVIIDNDDKMKNGFIHTSRNDKITQVSCIKLNFTADKVIKADFFVWIFEANDARSRWHIFCSLDQGLIVSPQCFIRYKSRTRVDKFLQTLFIDRKSVV